MQQKKHSKISRAKARVKGFLEKVQQNIIYISMMIFLTVAGAIEKTKIRSWFEKDKSHVQADTYSKHIGDTPIIQPERTELLVLTVVDGEYDQSYSSALKGFVERYSKGQNIVLSPMLDKDCFEKNINGEVGCILSDERMMKVRELLLVKLDRSYQKSPDGSRIYVDGTMKLCLVDVSAKSIEKVETRDLYNNGFTIGLANEKVGLEFVDSARNIIFRFLNLK